MSASKEVIVNGLETRLVKGSSELNSLKDDLIEKGICATSNMKNIINEIVDSNPKRLNLLRYLDSVSCLNNKGY